MSEEFVPSEAAQREGVCHTESECQALYEALDTDMRLAAALSLRDGLTTEAGTMQKLIDVKVHEGASYLDALEKEPDAAMFFGMGVRNYLRREGYGEKELGVHNMDCVFIYILRDAVKLEVERSIE
jgi:hypothetical protein